MSAKPVVAALLSGVLCGASCAPARTATTSFEASPPAASRAEPAPERPDPRPAPAVEFNTQIRPILEARCRPCHFEGGKMYARLPFDRPTTIRDLGVRLFSRIKDEQEQALIQIFLAQPADSDDAGVCTEPKAPGSPS